MRQAIRQVQQILVSILAILSVLSLSASSLAACNCSHHHEVDPDAKSSCHDLAKGVRHKSEPHHKATQAETGRAVSETCYCVQLRLNAPVKVEGFKLKKHSAALASDAKLTPVSSVSALLVPEAILDTAFRERRFYASTSTRGPPVS